VLFSILCAVGADDMFRRLATQRATRRRLEGTTLAAVAIVPSLLYATVPAVVKRIGVDLVRARRLPYRDNNRFFLNPNKRGEYGGARQFGEHAFQVVPPGE
jgi:hypothetical protein